MGIKGFTKKTSLHMKTDNIKAICSQPEVADDVISSYNVETFRDYNAANL